jgi:hypothetical protein
MTSEFALVVTSAETARPRQQRSQGFLLWQRYRALSPNGRTRATNLKLIAGLAHIPLPDSPPGLDGRQFARLSARQTSWGAGANGR